MIRDNIHWKSGALQVVLPNLESLKNSKEFLVMNIIVQLQRSKRPRMKSYGVDIGVRCNNREDCPEGIIGGIRLNDDLCVRSPMGKYRSRGKCLFQGVEQSSTGL